MPATGMKPDLC